jgi:hypothetical protein
MSFKVDPYLNRTFSFSSYNCWHFVQDVWKDLTGVDLGNQVPDDKSIASYNTRATDFSKKLTKLPNKKDPCIVLMLRDRTQPHIGVYYKGRLLHLGPRGAEYRPLEHVTGPYQTIEFYC